MNKKTILPSIYNKTFFINILFTFCFAVTSAFAQTSAQDLRACIQAGLPLFQISSVKYDRVVVLQTFYSKFCATTLDWSQLSRGDQEAVKATWIGQYGDFAGDWTKGGTVNSEEAHYKASCEVLEKQFQGNRVSLEIIHDVRGNQDELIYACQQANENSVRMIPQVPATPSGLLVLSFSTIVADREITGVQAKNFTCKLDGNVVEGHLSVPRTFTNNAAQIICERDHRPIAVHGSSGEYYPAAEIAVTTNYAQFAPKIALPEEVDGILRARLDKLEKRMNPANAIIALTGVNATCPPNWKELVEASGRFLRGGSQEFPAGYLSGEAAHNLTIQEMPAHNHGGSAGVFVARSPDAGSFNGGPIGTSSVRSVIAREGGGKAFPLNPLSLGVTFCINEED